MTPQRPPFSGRVVFDHIAKAAGQAVNRWLTDVLGAGTVTHNLNGNHTALIRQYGGEFPIVSGHLNFSGTGLDPRYQYFTLMREPVDRALSWLYFAAQDVPDAPPDIVNGARMFLASEGDESTEHFIESISNYCTGHYWRVNALVCDTDELKLETALAALEQYAVVGIYEEMPRFLAEVAQLLGIQAPARLPSVNVTSKRVAVAEASPKLRQRIVDLNTLDIELYRRVKEKLAARPPAALPAASPGWARYAEKPARWLCNGEILLGELQLKPGEVVVQGGLLTIAVPLLVRRSYQQLTVGIHVFDEAGNLAFGTNSELSQQQQLLHELQPGQYHLEFLLLAALPVGRYKAGFAIIEGRGRDAREIYWADASCVFSVQRKSLDHSVGFAELQCSMGLVRTMGAEERGVVRPAGYIRLLDEIAPRAGDCLTVRAALANEGDEHWDSGRFIPVHATYHWRLPDGRPLPVSELRTRLPPAGLAAGRRIELEMALQTPAEPGDYLLELTLVQEMTLWFEEGGFPTVRMPVRVAPAAA